MAIKKIPCGGWLYDDEQIEFEDGVMRVVGGGSQTMVVRFDVAEDESVTANKTVEEVETAMLTMPVVGVMQLGEDTVALGGAMLIGSEVGFGILDIQDSHIEPFIFADNGEWKFAGI